MNILIVCEIKRQIACRYLFIKRFKYVVSGEFIGLVFFEGVICTGLVTGTIIFGCTD